MGLKPRDADAASEPSLGAALRKAGVELPRAGRASDATASPQPAQAETPQPAATVEEPAVVQQPAAQEPQQAKPRAETATPANPQPQVHSNTSKGASMQQQQQTQRPTTLAEQLGSRNRIISRGSSSQRANSIYKLCSEQLAAASSVLSKGWSVLVMDHSNGLSFPLVMISWQQRDTAGNGYLVTFPLLIESEDLRLGSRVEKWDQVTYDVITTLGDVYTSPEYASVVEAHLRRTLNLDGKTQIKHAGAIRVPKGLEIVDTSVSELLFQAVNAIFATMDRYMVVRDEAPFTLVGRDMRAERLVGRISLNSKPLINEVGEPVRAELIARVDSSRQGTTMLMGDTNISTLAGYIEPIYRQPSTDPTKPHAPFLPQLVITHVRAGSDQTDLESYLLAITNGVNLITYRGSWVEQFRPKTSIKGSNELADIGALGLLTPKAEKFNTKDENFRANFDAYIREMFEVNGGMLVAIDVADVGPTAWMTDIFRACAAGNPDAIKAFTVAMDNLTGGRYSIRAQANGILGQSPVVNQSLRIHAGHYVHQDRGLSDIRDVDCLAVFNAYTTATEQIEEYLNSLVPTHGTENTRAAERYPMIDNILQGTQEITGYYTRLYFAQNQLVTMAQACEDAKLMIQPANTAYGLGNTQRMGGFDFQSLLSAPAGQGMFGGTVGAGTVQGVRW